MAQAHATATARRSDSIPANEFQTTQTASANHFLRVRVRTRIEHNHAQNTRARTHACEYMREFNNVFIRRIYAVLMYKYDCECVCLRTRSA